MGAFTPSRRQLLGGLLATLFGWLFGYSQIGTLPPLPQISAAPSPQRLQVHRTFISYDGAGNCNGARSSIHLMYRTVYLGQGRTISSTDCSGPIG
jgi:hypothetical protein